MPNSNIDLTGKYMSQTWTRQIIKDDDGHFRTGDGKQISYWNQGGITEVASVGGSASTFWATNPQWLFDLDTNNGYGRYVLSDNNFSGTYQNVGTEITNNEDIYRNYLITCDFTGRFIDDTRSKSNRLLMRLCIDGEPTTASCLLFNKSNSLNVVSPPYPDRYLYQRMVSGSINHTYRSNTSWNLDFLVTTTQEWSAALAGEFRFDTFWWTVSTI